MKKNSVYILLLAVSTIISCKKNASCPTVTYAAPASEVTALKAYLDANSISAIADSRGFFYTISNAGSSGKPTTCNTVTVSYTGRLTSGTVFDSGNGVSFPLSNLILGWQEGIPLIGAGGSIILYLPPSLAYGASGSGPIPPNANLIFAIDLAGF